MASKQLFTIMLLTFILVSSGFDSKTFSSKPESIFASSNQARVPHPQILISSPTDFIDLGFSGDGSESAPFLIEDLEITSVGQDILDASCIRITGCPGIYYTIRNCIVSGSRRPWLGYAGISLESGIARIEDCDVLNCSTGIAAGGIPISIEDCRVWNCSDYAILVENSNDFTISSSRIEMYYLNGLYISYSSNVDIQENQFLCDSLSTRELGYHLWVEKCESINVEDNELLGGPALYVFFARYCTDLLVKNNSFTTHSYGGFRVVSSNNTKVLDCTFEQESPIIYPHPLFHIGGEPDYQTAWNAYVKNCTFTNFENARIWFVENGTITNCHFFNSSVLAVADSAKITHNEVINGSINIFTRIDGVEVAHNTITQVETIGIQDSGVNSYIHNNTVIGTGLYDSVGIDLSNRSIVHMNTVRSFHYGIYGPGSLNTGCIITNNTIQKNAIGLYFGSPADENKVYYNYFIDNSKGAEDNGDDNQWDDGVSMGNYWTEILFPGAYTVPGSANAVDRYALPYRPSVEIIADNAIMIVAIGAVVVSLLAVVLLRRRKT